MSEEILSKRRTFLSRLNTGVASAAALAIGVAAKAQTKSGATQRWQPARHEKDDWLDQLPGRHRMVFDTTTPEGLGEALLFAGNFLTVNRSDYGLQSNDLAVVIIVRYQSVGFAYNNTIWAKHGDVIATRAGFRDPRTNAVPNTNLYNATDYGNTLRNRGTTWDSLAAQGVQLAVCSVATRNVADAIAGPGGNSDTIVRELTSNLVVHARMVPAGIVAVNRAQERGYTLVTV
jgi:hypothetical protein